jgi:hypothetical protein
MHDMTWTLNDIEFWTVTRTATGDWAVVDVRDERIIRRFPTAGRAEGWIDALVRGDAW